MTRVTMITDIGKATIKAAHSAVEKNSIPLDKFEPLKQKLEAYKEVLDKYESGYYNNYDTLRDETAEIFESCQNFFKKTYFK